jgi:hypothetical protein
MLANLNWREFVCVGVNAAGRKLFQRLSNVTHPTDRLLPRKLTANPGCKGGDPWPFGGQKELPPPKCSSVYLRRSVRSEGVGQRVRAVVSWRSVRNRDNPRVRPSAKSRMAVKTIMFCLVGSKGKIVSRLI